MEGSLSSVGGLACSTLQSIESTPSVAGENDQHQSLSKEAGEQGAGSAKIEHRARAPEQKKQPFGLLGIHDCGEDESLMSVRRTFEDSIKKARRFQASFHAQPCAYTNYGGAE